MNKIQHLKLNIKGSLKKFWNSWLIHRRMHELGVNVKDVKDISFSEIQVVVSGDKQDLWKVVKWSKDSDLFFVPNEVVFEFAEVEL